MWRRNTSDGVKERATGAGLMLWYLAVVIFLFAPIVAGVVYSFNLGVVNKQTATLKIGRAHV